MAFNKQGGIGTGLILNLDRVFTSQLAFIFLSGKDGTMFLSRKVQP